MFVCSAGNGPQGGPYVLCQCVAPAMPVGPKAQGELDFRLNVRSHSCKGSEESNTFLELHSSLGWVSSMV